MPSTMTDRLTGITTSVAVKAPVAAVATSNITLSGEKTVSLVACVTGDRVLATAQTSSVDNGIWVVSTGAWSRAVDFNGAIDVRKGTVILVADGTSYRLSTADPITIGTSSLTFVERTTVVGETSVTAIKAPVRVVSTGNLTLSGTQTVGGVALVAGDRILVNAQTTATQNGIYVVSASAWTRATDFDESSDVQKGTKVSTTDGAWWRLTTADPITIGSSNISFSVESTVITAADIGALLWPTLGTETGVVYEYYPYGDVRRFGALADDTLESGTTAATTNNATAFNNAWASIKSTGGSIYVPPGKYYLNATWLLDVDLTLPHNYRIEAEGAVIRNGTGVTGFAVQVYGSFNYNGVKIFGLHVNHRNNATAAGAVQLKGASGCRLEDVSVELYSNAATWTAFELAAITPGIGDTHSFWNILDGCSTRLRSGADGGGAYSYCGINLKGQANATKIQNCRLSSVTHGIRMETDGVTQGFANGVNILANDFEGLTNALTIFTTPPSGFSASSRDAGTAYGPTGLRFENNRLESMTTVINFNGTVCRDHSHPPIISHNYHSNDITNYVVNANNQRIRVLEHSQYGFTATNNEVGGPTSFVVLCDGTGKNLRVMDDDSKSDYDRAHLIIGGYHLWINDPDGGTGKLRMKWGAPTSATDGTVVGTQT